LKALHFQGQDVVAELREEGGKGWGRGGGGQGGEMTQTMYAHVNKRIKQFFKKYSLREKAS
jgi:hypothetical protein